MICSIFNRSRHFVTINTTDGFHFHPEGLEIHINSMDAVGLVIGTICNIELQIDSDNTVNFQEYKLRKIEYDADNTSLVYFQAMSMDRTLQTQIMTYNHSEIVLDSASFAYMPEGLFVDTEYCPDLAVESICNVKIISNNQVALSVTRCVFEGCEQIDESTKILFFSTGAEPTVPWKKEGF